MMANRQDQSNNQLADDPDIMTDPHKQGRELLQYCQDTYEYLWQRFLEFRRRAEPEQVLAGVEGMARFAWMHHPGKFADSVLEQFALEIGTQLELLISDLSSGLSYNNLRLPGAHSSRRCVLHVATSAYEIGGHSRAIANWIRNDPTSNHWLILTRQKEGASPGWLSAIVRASGGAVISLADTMTIIQKAYELRQISLQGFQSVILHTHPDDVVPLVAFAPPTGPSVGCYNHADHVFWLGASIADVMIHFRDSGATLSQARRCSRKNFVLPIPLDPRHTKSSRSFARAQLGMANDQVILLSIGTCFKYSPTCEHNFFQATRAILEEYSRAHLYLIGVTPAEATHYGGQDVHPRTHCLGVLPDPSLYQQAADIYLEGFPIGSLTSLLETAQMGAAVVLKHLPLAPIVAGKDPALESLLSQPPREEYANSVNRLIADPAQRQWLSRRIQQRVVESHTGTTWCNHLQDLYAILADQVHQPAGLVDTVSKTTLDDLASCQVQELGTERQAVDQTAQTVCHGWDTSFQGSRNKTSTKNRWSLEQMTRPLRSLSKRLRKDSK